MSDLVLVAYATKRGSTREVAEEIAGVLAAAGLPVETCPAGAVESLDGYSGAVLGGALYMGRVHHDARRFLKRFREPLAALPTAVFAMGPSSAEEDEIQRSREQLDRALAAVPEIDPLFVAIFGGVVDPEKLSFQFSRMPAVDARNWDDVRTWAAGIALVFGARQRAAVAGCSRRRPSPCSEAPGP